MSVENLKEEYDLIILGGGPAGLTAAAYAIRKRIETMLISEDLGGKTNYQFYLPAWIETPVRRRLNHRSSLYGTARPCLLSHNRARQSNLSTPARNWRVIFRSCNRRSNPTRRRLLESE
jgi:glycine/D-amino acid oxidase-like deaminating enzyme